VFATTFLIVLNAIMFCYEHCRVWSYDIRSRRRLRRRTLFDE
jgi:hypothetical protein